MALGTTVRYAPLLLLVAVACKTREGGDGTPPQIQAEVAIAQAERSKVSLEPVAVATVWLEALRDGADGILQSHTRFPFELHDETGRCAGQTAAGAEQLSSLLACLRSDAALMDILRTHETAAIEPIPLARLEAWANRWHVQPTPGLQIISGYFARQDARYTLDVQVDGQGVVAVWKSGINGSREIQIARQWLNAVKARDVEALERLTSYPFEVRDAGRDALCGKRTATSQAELSGAVACMFRSDLLHHALTESPSPGFTADDASDSLPNWIGAWWREKDHRQLQRVSTMVSTLEGDEFDFQMLVARDGGVRTVWKAGGFEAPD